MSEKIRWELTGENRPPQTGEWFQGERGPVQAMFDFTEQSFPILTMTFKKEKEKEMNATNGGCVVTEQDGDMRCAHFGDFTNLQECPAGFGGTDKEAIRALFLDAANAERGKEKQA